MTAQTRIRAYATGDARELADAWTKAAPADGITYTRFVEQVLFDRNFDRQGLRVAVQDGRIVGAAYAVRRRIAIAGSDLEPGSGWVPFFFVTPDARGAGVGTALLQEALSWLESEGVSTTYFSSYTPNYFLPGLDAEQYPEAAGLLEKLGFTAQYTAFAMERSLADFVIPERVHERIAALRAEGYYLGEAQTEDLVDLIELAVDSFNPDWGRAIREAYLTGLSPERIMMVRDPEGAALGWAMHGTYENVVDRFGPFGVLPRSRGAGLGEILLHLTLERMRASGAHSAWFLWADEGEPAHRLYLRTGFTAMRRFTILHRHSGEERHEAGTD